MNAKQFFQNVALMRQKQKEYFKTRSPIALQDSKILEKAIDAEIERVQKLQKEPELNFGDNG